MQNLIESNERTLVMFDSVCAGLSSCLSLVHADIRQMTEHRNQLALLEHQHIQAKLVPARELAGQKTNNDLFASDQRPFQQPSERRNKRKKRINESDPHEDAKTHSQQQLDEAAETDDPHHLSKLKLLDKRLADSFSHALNLSDLQKSSIHAKHLQSGRSGGTLGASTRPSFFQALLGKSSKTNDKSDAKKSAALDELQEEPDNRTVIDDINRQTRLAMQYSKQLEAHLFKVEDLKSKYEMHLKMGLVVKSVAKAYLTSGSNCSSINQQSPATLSRRHHCSSLMINDSASLGTHSSVSSLNLYTWSSSRSKARNRQEAINQYNQAALNNNNIHASTISLNSKNHRRLNLAKLISSAKNNNDSQPYDSNGHNHQQQLNNVLSFQVTNSPTIGARGQTTPNQNNNYAYTAAATVAAEWNVPEMTKGKLSDNDGLSKSTVQLNASQTSLKRSRSNKSQQANSKTTIKEFIENIDKIEAEFESYMGSFLFAIEDIQGFARVCQGDVFEISIKYGDSQKFKTKISVLKDNIQKCANRQTVFKARIADVLAIKAYECKGLGKRILLGHKLCETRDLFTARSQLMTISLNQTGSIKLNLIVTWNPLHLAPNSASAAPGLDISHISLPPTPASSSTLSSLSSGPSMNGTMTTINIQSSQKRNRKPNVSNTSPDSHNDSMYQTVDPTYGYYIPPPDYLTNEEKISR